METTLTVPAESAADTPAVPAGQLVTVRVPATSANLGPGYDSLGLALSLYDTLTVETLDSGELEFELSGEGADTLPRDASHLVVKAITEALHRLGFRHEGLRITADNVNPHGRGLGLLGRCRGGRRHRRQRPGPGGIPPRQGLDPAVHQRAGRPPGQRRTRHFRRTGAVMAGQ